MYFSTYYSIPNIDIHNNKLYYGKNKVIEIPIGSYELQDLSDYLKNNVDDCEIELTCNNNTLRTTILCSEDIHFEKEDSFGKMLGFGRETLKANIINESKYPVNILSTTVVRVECDIIAGSYINGNPRHIIHEFVPNVPPGYRIIEIPKNVIYFDVNQKLISCINFKLFDSENRLINFRGEEIQLYLHLRKKT